VLLPETGARAPMGALPIAAALGLLALALRWLWKQAPIT
jgi:hypothetical protein